MHVRVSLSLSLYFDVVRHVSIEDRFESLCIPLWTGDPLLSLLFSMVSFNVYVSYRSENKSINIYRTRQ